jgi:hypothetical protein
MNTLQITERKLKIARTTEFTDVVMCATAYVTNKGSLHGIEFTLKTLPYPLRVLSKANPKMFQQSTVKFTGVMRDYNGQQYFDAKDVEVVEMSNLAKLAVAGIHFASDI